MLRRKLFHRHRLVGRTTKRRKPPPLLLQLTHPPTDPILRRQNPTLVPELFDVKFLPSAELLYRVASIFNVLIGPPL